MDGKPTKFLLDWCKWKSSRTCEQNSNLNHKKLSHGPATISQT